MSRKPMCAAYFVTGTSTEVGKTATTQAILVAARARAISAVGYKPVESGSTGAVGPDAAALAQAAGTKAATTYVFRRPISPCAAAQEEGKVIQLSPMVNKAAALKEEHQLLLVEGAGGLLVPLEHESRLSIADLAVALKMPLLVVAEDCLGSVNHSLLTLEAARHRGLEVAALVLSECKPGSGEGLSNAEQIAHHGQVRVISLPHSPREQGLQEAGDRILSELLSNTETGKELI